MAFVLTSPRSSLRDWGLFFLVASLPALAVGMLGLRALRNEEAALRRELRTQAEATALAIEQSFSAGLRAVEEGTVQEDAPVWAEAVAIDAATIASTERPAQAAVAGEDRPEATTTTCRRLAEELRSGKGDAWRGTAEAIAKRCQDARTERGRSLWPLVALDPRLALKEDRIAAWLDRHEARLDAIERETIRREVAAASWLDTSAKDALDRRLRSVPSGRGGALVSAHRYAMRLGRSPIVWSDSRSAGRLERRADGGYAGLVIHAGSLTTAIERGWPDLPDGFEARLSQGGAEAPFPLSHRARLLGELRLVVGHPRPDEVARRSKLALGGVALGAGLLAIALAALLFSRMRRARQVSALRTDFVAAVSHELRTPIASVRVLAELLAQDRVEPEERQEVHEALAREAKRLGATVDRLLGFSRMEAGRARIDARRVDLKQLVEDAIATFEGRFPEAGPIERRWPPDALVASVDADGVRMVVDNLLGNARKYAPDGTPYEVRLRRADGGVELSVTDHGPGIARRHQRRIFRPFERADDRLSEATEGSGIGLSLVQHVARSHGGRASVTSQPGEGATFIVWLPTCETTASEREA
ncbi:MAG TPA: HAMP domain-containing histidine kinase [Polyangiaceae bacterium]|nr:HAMP domain-containing histidine kinase [Polyangiaceae bacterium]